MQNQFVNGQQSLGVADYTQNFDGLAATGSTNTSLPTGWSISEANYTASTGSSNSGAIYSYGSSSSDRALGSLCSGSVGPVYYGAYFKNTTGSALTFFTITYTGEQWRKGTSATKPTDSLEFQYSTNATTLTGGTWVNVQKLNFVTPAYLSSIANGALDGNNSSYRTTISRTIGGLNIANNAKFYIRWMDSDDTGSDAGLAIDDFTISTTTILPVNWVSFLAKETREGILLHWNTSNEINSNLFDVQHSTDGSHWNNIGNVTAAGNSVADKSYSYLHTSPAFGNNFYRLNQIDIDGKSTYSNVVSILSTIPNTAVKILSNPIQNGLLQVQVGQAQSIVLQNAVGQIMVQKTLAQGLNNINVGNLPKGIYFVKVGNTFKKIVLQ
jgi:hypothetical protein